MSDQQCKECGLWFGVRAYDAHIAAEKVANELVTVIEKLHGEGYDLDACQGDLVEALQAAHAAGLSAERARVNKAIDALAHGDNLAGQSAYGVVVALREAVGQ